MPALLPTPTAGRSSCRPGPTGRPPTGQGPDLSTCRGLAGAPATRRPRLAPPAPSGLSRGAPCVTGIVLG
eukprot:3887472-Alexandrium_andersonii.AAC.1